MIASAAAFYIFLLAMTLVFKVLYLRTAFGREGIARGVGLAPLSAAKAAYAAILVASPDAIQLAIIALIALVLAVISRKSTATMVGILAVAGVLGLINFFACRQIGTLLTSEHVGVAWSWLARNPPAAFGFLTSGTLSRMGIALAGVVALLVIATIVIARAHRRRTGSVVMVIAACIVAVAIGSRVARPASSSEGVVSTPYWSAALASLRMSDKLNPLGAAQRSLAELKQRAKALGAADSVTQVTPGRIAPRYIVIVSLETAPLGFYPILANPEFPAFNEMSQNGITTAFHYATMPRTTEALYSVVTGMYPVDDLARVVVRRRSRRTFLQTIEQQGFVTTFIDSFSRLHGWFKPSETLWSRLGFDRVVYGVSDDPSFEGMQESERRSFASAVASIDSARAANRGAYVVVSTALGHFPWPSRKSDAHNRNVRSTRDIMFAMDSLTGDLLRALDARSIRDSSVVIVTGDHGFRFRAEFSATGREADDPFLTFNVPLLMYAPGAVSSRRLDAPTSHVDIAPTILSLLGIRDDSLLVHGRDLTNEGDDRPVFLSSAGLSPYEGFALGDSLYIMNTVTGRIARRASASAKARSPVAMSDSAVRAILRESVKTIDETLAYQFAQKER